MSYGLTELDTGHVIDLGAPLAPPQPGQTGSRGRVRSKAWCWSLPRCGPRLFDAGMVFTDLVDVEAMVVLPGVGMVALEIE